MRGCLEHRDTILTAYNGQLIRHYGTTRLKCAHETTTCNTEFLVADTTGPVILVLPTCRKLKLVTLNCAVNEDHPPLKSKEDLLRMYPDCFEGIGKFCETFHITLHPTVTPVVHAPRRCPIHIKDLFNLQLFRPEKASAVLGVCVTCIVGACGSVSVYLQHCDL